MKNTKEGTYSFFKVNRLVLVLPCLFFTMNIYAQNREIRGMVTGDDNKPLAGAIVTVKNRQDGMIIDIDGEFTIRAKTGEILVVSFLSMKKQEIKIDNKDLYAIELPPEASEFDEVTVIASAKQEKESIISAASTVNPQELKVPSNNLTTTLARGMSGLAAFQTSGESGKDNAQFFVRDATTFRYKKDPLVLIDNIELSTDDLARLDVDDIAQFFIMGDATATALYGTHGANGVILVTTKQGTAGRPKVSVRVKQSVPTLRKKTKLTGPVGFMKLNNEAVNSRRDPNNPAASANYTIYSRERIENTIAGTNPYYYPAVDWYDGLFNDYALSARVDANLGGGDSAVYYYVAASYTKDGGVIKNDKLNNYNSNINWQRYPVRSNISMNLGKTAKFAIHVNENFGDYTGPLDSDEGLYKKVTKISPVLYPKSYLAIDEYTNNTHVLFGSANKGTYINPYTDMVKEYKESNNLLVAVRAELRQRLDSIAQGLGARVLVSTTRSSYSSLTRAINPYYYQANYDKTNNSYTLTNIVEGGEYLSYNQGAKNISTTDYIETAVSYGRALGAHATSGMLVYTHQEEKRSSERTLQRSLPCRSQGIAGRFTYAYDSEYFAEFNFGYNGFERFAAHGRYGFSPSFGLGYIISNEDFWVPLRSTVDKLKFKLTYGLVSNDAIGSSEGRFYYLSEMNPSDGSRDQFLGTDYDNHTNGVSVSHYPNIYITWEKLEKVNLSFEPGMFNSALEIQTDFFYGRHTQIYQPRAHIPSSMRLSTGVSASIGGASSRGASLSANYSYITNKDFWIKGMGNFTLARDRCEVYEELGYASYGQGYRFRTGQAINHDYGYIAEHLFIDVNDVANSPSQTSFNGGAMPGDIKYKDLNGDGKITDENQTFLDYPSQLEITYSFGFSAGYKGFDFPIFFQGNARASFFIDPRNTSPLTNYDTGDRIGVQQCLDVIANDYWSENNRDIYAFWPRLPPIPVDNNMVTSTWWMHDGSFLRLKTVELGYTFSRRALKKTGVQSLRLYLTGNDLLTFSKFKLWNTEMGNNGLRYPIQRVYNLDISINFQ